MTIIDAITQADETNKNGYSMLQKITWLSRVEAMVKKEVIDTHDGGCGIRFSRFDESTPPDTKLIMPEPYDECYVHWIQAQVHFANEETDRYNRSISMFNALYSDFKGFWKRNHRPKGCGRFRF